MAIRTLEEMKAYAEANCPEDFAKLPDPGSYHIVPFGGFAKLCIGDIAANAIPGKVTGTDDHTLKVWVNFTMERSLSLPAFALIITADGDIRLTRSFHHHIKLCEPFCWIWPSITDELGMDKFTALVRYVFETRGYPGGLSHMHFSIHEVFPQICADVVRGQGIKKMNSVWGNEGIGSDSDVETSEETEAEDPQQTRSVTFKDHMQYLDEEYDAFKATLWADHEEQEAKRVEETEKMD